MPLKDIKRYLELCKKGDESLQERMDIMLAQKESIESQIKFLQLNMKELEYKIWYYEEALKAGTEKIHKGHPCCPTFEPDEIPK